jgi:hypothetical protein
MKILKKLRQQYNIVRDLPIHLHHIQESIGRIEARQTRESFTGNLASAEFRAFSQWGEDGIIQAILDAVKPARRTFIEFGVQDYRESNTRFLLIHNNWAGLVIDGSQANIDYIRKDPIYWQYNLKAEREFITRDNINDIFSRCGLSGEIGLLSIDIDGNDYWVWKAITSVNPAVVVTEYNARFGPDRTVTVPYTADFVRSNAHYSQIYYGASLGAMDSLAREKGYVLVGCNSAGNNAFFVRSDLMAKPLRAMSAAEAYVANQFREARLPDGSLAFLTPTEERALIDTLPLVEVGAPAPMAAS